MNRSKVYMAISAVCLAAVGVAATKIQNSAIFLIKYRPTSTTCALGLVTRNCSGTTNVCNQYVYTSPEGIDLVSKSKYDLFSITTPCLNHLLTQ